MPTAAGPVSRRPRLETVRRNRSRRLPRSYARARGRERPARHAKPVSIGYGWSVTLPGVDLVEGPQSERLRGQQARREHTRPHSTEEPGRSQTATRVADTSRPAPIPYRTRRAPTTSWRRHTLRRRRRRRAGRVRRPERAASPTTAQGPDGQGNGQNHRGQRHPVCPDHLDLRDVGEQSGNHRDGVGNGRSPGEAPPRRAARGQRRASGRRGGCARPGAGSTAGSAEREGRPCWPTSSEKSRPRHGERQISQ